jgi:acyl carrier protein
MNRDILGVVDELFRRQLQVPELNPDVPLVDYGLDSVRSIDAVIELESAFDIRISDDQAASMQTLRDVVDRITASLTVSAGQGDADV